LFGIFRLDLFHVLPHVPFLLLVAQEEGRVVDGYEQGGLIVVKAAPGLRDALVGRKQGRAAKVPRQQMILGLMAASCFLRNGRQASISSGKGFLFSGGWHLMMLQI
jgi:hypothetical protein